MFELAFSEEPELSYKVLRDVSLAATDGAVRKAQRLERPSNIRWRITVEPSGWDDVTVTVLDDALDDGEETLTLALSNASGARIRDGAATGMIVNSDPLPRAWLARFGRTAAGHVLDAVGERLAGTRRDTQVSIAGRRLSAAPAADTPAYDDPLQRWEEPRTMQLAELVDGSSFNLLAATGSGADALDAGAGADDGGRWTVWGRGGWSRFEGTQGELSLEGQVITATAGADYERDRLLAGLAVAYSSGDGTFDHAASGDSGGARGTLLAAPAGGGFEVTATADGMVLRMRSEAVPGRVVATEADVERVRLLLNASYRIPVGGGLLTPRIEVGARHDGGDGEPVRRSDRGRRRRPHLAGGHELPARPIPQPEPGRHPPRARRRRRARAHPGAARLPAPLTKSTSAHVIASRALEAMESVP